MLRFSQRYVLGLVGYVRFWVCALPQFVRKSQVWLVSHNQREPETVVGFEVTSVLTIIGRCICDRLCHPALNQVADGESVVCAECSCDLLRTYCVTHCCSVAHATDLNCRHVELYLFIFCSWLGCSCHNWTLAGLLRSSTPPPPPKKKTTGGTDRQPHISSRSPSEVIDAV